MFLEKLQINGFKSFAENTELKFGSGITAIVGPNGSGKSNVADAVRWVLGEQSMKSIRGKKSEDVIFAGSDKKSRLGLAEASLFLNNEDNKALIDYSELVLTRRFYRSGEGEYLLNNNKTRLLDISLLLAKANIGYRTYSVIGQGQVDSVLVATPAERKDFFDEATGVKQYQIKRDQALHKLERTWDNMSQGKLMLNEISPHLRSLTRQVKRLQQKEEVEIKLKALQHYYYYGLWSEYSGAQQKLKEEKLELQKNMEDFGSNQLELNNEMKKLGSQDSREDKFNELQAEYENIQKIKQGLLRELAVLEGKQDLQIEKSGGRDLVWTIKRQRDVSDLLSKNNKVLSVLKNDLNLLQKNLSVKQDSQDNIIDRFNKIEEKISSIHYDNNGNLSFSEVKFSLESASEKLKRLIQDFIKTESKEEIDRLIPLIDDVRDSLNNIISNIPDNNKTETERKHEELKRQLADLLAGKDNLVNEIRDIEFKINVLEVKILSNKENIDLLDNEKRELDSLIKESQDYLSEDLQKKTSDLQDKISKVDERLQGANKALQQFNQVEQEKKNKLLLLQTQIQEVQEKINNENNKINNINIELARFDTKQEDLSIEVHRELDLFIANLIDEWQKISPTIDEDLENFSILEQIENLKKKKELIGGIEPEAIDEYKEVKEKHDFLTNQVGDLTESMEKLKTTIEELDEIITRQFTENFIQINELFNRYFRMLFSGGRAELVLIKSEENNKLKEKEFDEESESEGVDIIENEDEDELIKFYKYKKVIQGIEIKATPPGKKMKGIGMLSGGERALTSIALICAMIANNPSPFVVLDEVDAALDEANSIRFAEIISELSKQTQFIVITHNRATMEKADILYGITMGNDGVSNLLSVKFEEAQEYANRY